MQIPLLVKKEKAIARFKSIQILKGVVFNQVAKICGASSYEKIS